MSKVKYLDFDDDLSIRVGKFLIEKGFTISDYSGKPINLKYRREEIGIIRQDTDRLEKPRILILGVIWFNSSPRKASPKNWVIETYGKKFKQVISALAEEMARKFDVDITVIQESPDEKVYYEFDGSM